MSRMFRCTFSVLKSTRLKAGIDADLTLWVLELKPSVRPQPGSTKQWPCSKTVA
jgi:hypothetical protein